MEIDGDPFTRLRTPTCGCEYQYGAFEKGDTRGGVKGEESGKMIVGDGQVYLKITF